MRTLLPRMMGASVAAMTVGGIISAQVRHAAAGRGSFRYFDAPSGNRLAYALRGTATGGDSPLIVLESGHQASHRYWHWVAEDLGGDHRVLMYNRAGYPPSEYRSRSTYSIRESVDDLAALVSRLADDDDVVLVGHSLGGYLVHRLAAEPTFSLLSLVLIDPTHPEEILRVPSRSDGAKVLDRSHATVVSSLRLGWGGLLDSPDWVRDFPREVGSALKAEFRDYGAWATTAREWSSLHQLFRSPPSLQRAAAHAWIVAASQTLATAAEQRDFFEDYIRASGGGRIVEIEGATHLTILSAPAYAAQVAAVVREAAATKERS